jgi:hypothetical protein
MRHFFLLLALILLLNIYKSAKDEKGGDTGVRESFFMYTQRNKFNQFFMKGV